MDKTSWTYSKISCSWFYLMVLGRFGLVGWVVSNRILYLGPKYSLKGLNHQTRGSGHKIDRIQIPALQKKEKPDPQPDRDPIPSFCL